ncbi:maleylpyruvate isomerase N-terminal domain-containing protein [Streptomyces sp. NBC_00094]|uniref:maleylpyruvate isomerase N-terminal domain-containing protein n=1 Tax=Streptomyces sp. NBC_00094 TaxID=2903620 RepID=UPI002259A7B8|nr:maleylpyruvate isomerase N-terminal domain-containing protein [Streptomyces sp. NBC_00094]MCX5388545.1 maleylpyruvate isomerase N-terminal domain-containing protein [Streptomyces sp. NBC_00094]
MENTPEFAEILRLIDDRATAFRAAVASAPGLDVQVPTCPEWTLFDLAQHLGQGRRFWAATVAAGPADAPPAEAAAERSVAAPGEREALPPTAFDFHAEEGRSWRLTADGDGARCTRLPAAVAASVAVTADEGLDAAGVSVRGTASELVLFIYDRIPAESLRIDGDTGLIDLLCDWEPEG